MHKKKWYLLLVMLLMGALLLSACGGDEEPAEEPAGEVEEVEEVEEPTAEPTEEPVEEPTEEPMEEPTEEPMEEPTEEPAEEPTEEAAAEEEMAEDIPDNALVLWADDTRSPVLQEVGDAFEAEFGLPVAVVQLAFGDIRDQLQIAGPAGEGPDIIIGAHDWLGTLVESGMLLPIDLGEKEEMFADAALNAFTYNGELYGMPYAIENVAFIYNPEILAEGGFDAPPETWEEVTEIATALEEQGLVEQGYIIQQNDPYHFFPIMTAYGGYVFGQTEDGNYNPEDLGIASEGTIEGAQWLQQMAEAGHVQPGVDYDVMHEQFENGNAAMMITGPWALPRIRESGVPYEVTTLPAGSEAAKPFLGAQGFMVSAFSEQPLVAETFLVEYVATEEVMAQLFEADPRPPVFQPVLENLEDPDLATFAEAGTEGLAMPGIPAMDAVWTAWGNAMEFVILGEQDAEAAFSDAAESIQNTLEQ
jgi:maltose/maltodextrin transport system substrate-binding protein/arabinogalactan oligomer/maltooligosaccharide transport system substrate-binding protein